MNAVALAVGVGVIVALDVGLLFNAWRVTREYRLDAEQSFDRPPPE